MCVSQAVFALLPSIWAAADKTALSFCSPSQTWQDRTHLPLRSSCKKWLNSAIQMKSYRKCFVNRNMHLQLLITGPFLFCFIWNLHIRHGCRGYYDHQQWQQYRYVFYFYFLNIVMPWNSMYFTSPNLREPQMLWKSSD